MTEISKNVDGSQYIDAMFWDHVYAEGYPLIERSSWQTERTRIPDPFGEVVARQRWSGQEQILIKHNGCLGTINLGSGQVWSGIAGTDETAIAEFEERLREALPATQGDGMVPISFWTYTPNGPRCSIRRITVPSWEEITSNYPGRVREELEELMSDRFRPSFGGQLVLWQGEPGTGKTWALRALASEWQTWAEFHYITDPERFFGSNSDYMLDVLLHGSDMIEMPEPGTSDSKWKILILEDTGELLSADAKERSGQALSRLLNVVDGIIGQGLRVLVLVTTNEAIRTLHPAVARPGRCASQIEFVPMTGTEAREWLEEQGVDETDRGHMTLAEAYARISGFHGKRISAKVGF